MVAEIAKGFERLAIDIENHIRYYTPRNWTVPISNVDHVPLFSANEVKIFMQAHKKNTLKGKLDELSKNTRFPYAQLNPWYMREAVQDFFNKKLYSEYEKEL
jgi:hypothetical protein